MIGKLILVVGPSGAGKDSIIRFAVAQLKDDPRFVFPRRVITRKADIAAEDHDTVDAETFLAMSKQGAFTLQWQAHDLHYGVPKYIDNDLAVGKNIIVNVSRTILAEVPTIYLNYMVIEITASPEILAGRIAMRDRSSDGDVMKRATRKVAALGSPLNYHVIRNETNLESACEEFCALIKANTQN